MKDRLSLGFEPLSPRMRRSGVALVVVLGMLVLVLVLVVAFLSSVSVELQSAKKYSGGSDARALADSAVSLVISQIQDATAAPELAWASQPGMIRTYDNAGYPTAAYKLYSSDILRVAGSFNPVSSLSTEVPSDWFARVAQFTDLNKPVAVSGSNKYPIIDPAAVSAKVSGGPALEGSSPIEGCFLDTGSPAVSSGAQPNPVPMPVKWLYILQSGSIVPIDENGKVAGASKADPIVGRIAFWTDDETAKINVNTASEGTFWDRPWATSGDTEYEKKLSTSVPVQNEFQRYPGHPAMTSLSTVFPGFGVSGSSKEMLYGIIPRVAEGGSTQGAVTTSKTTNPIVTDNQRLFASVDEFFFSATDFSGGKRAANPNGSGAVLNVSDLEKTRFFLTANSRAPEVNLFNKPRVTLWPLQVDPVERSSKDKLIAFCSTVGSTPYYFQRYNTYVSPTQSPIPSSQSPLMDWDQIARNQQLYAYLQSLILMPLPGLGGSLGVKYPTSRDQILTQMFDLIRSMVNTFNTAEIPNYYYTPFSPLGMIAGQGQVVPLELPNGTKGFGRFPTITEAALVFYQKSQLTITGSMPANGSIVSGTVTLATFTSGTYLNKYPLGEGSQASIKISGNSYTVDYESPDPRTFGAVLILEPFNPTPGAPPWSASVRYVIDGADSLGLGFSSTMTNLVTSIDSSINATAQTGLEPALQKPPRAPKTLGTTDPDAPTADIYPFATTFTQTGTTFNFSGGLIKVKIYQGSVRPLDEVDLVQTINLNFPAAQNIPLPQVAKKSVASGTTTLTLYTTAHKTYCDFGERLSRMVSSSNVGKGRWGIAEDGQHRPLPLVLGANDSVGLGDTVRSVEARYGGPAQGDYRLIAGLKNVPADYFEGHGEKDPLNTTGPAYSGTAISGRLVHSLQIDAMQGSSDTGASNGYYTGAGAAGDTRGKLVNANYNDPRKGTTARNSTMPVAPRGLAAALMFNGKPGDWDTGPGTIADGPYVNMPDQANANTSQGNLFYAKGGYISSSGIVESGASYSPNRQIASAVAFGSLPSEINPVNPGLSKPWQTLLFTRQPAAGDNHPGLGIPIDGPPYSTAPDHAFLDLFTMPIVEPYAISEPFSTAGKVNMNYQIVPFTYLTRNTAVRAVLKATNMMAIPTNAGDSYKYTNNSPPPFRYTIDADETVGTLRGFEKRFGSGDIFRSASEICSISLVPKLRVDGQTPDGSPAYDTMTKWWEDFMLTGDNVREGPYGQLYPRLTTKSNTFTVHVQAQSIGKNLTTLAEGFVEGKDQVTGEFRGSFLIERYLDPNSDSLVDANGQPANELDADAMVGPYKFRVVSTKRFAP